MRSQRQPGSFSRFVDLLPKPWRKIRDRAHGLPVQPRARSRTATAADDEARRQVTAAMAPAVKRDVLQGLNRPAITATIICACVMQGLDTTIVNVSLPHIQGTMSASQDEISWVLTSYIVSAAIAMPLVGWLADRLGVKYLFLASVIGFTLAPALCGAATSLTQLVLFRLLQGLFSAGLVPLGQATLYTVYPP